MGVFLFEIEIFVFEMLYIIINIIFRCVINFLLLSIKNICVIHVQEEWVCPEIGYRAEVSHEDPAL